MTCFDPKDVVFVNKNAVCRKIAKTRASTRRVGRCEFWKILAIVRSLARRRFRLVEKCPADPTLMDRIRRRREWTALPSVPEVRYFNNPTQGRQAAVWGYADGSRDCVSKTRYCMATLWRVSDTQPGDRLRHPILRSTPLRLYGVIRIPCLRHESATGTVLLLSSIGKSEEKDDEMTVTRMRQERYRSIQCFRLVILVACIDRCIDSHEQLKKGGFAVEVIGVIGELVFHEMKAHMITFPTRLKIRNPSLLLLSSGWKTELEFGRRIHLEGIHL